MVKKQFDYDKVEWQWDTACKIYCKQCNKNIAELSDEDESIIWQYSANHLAFFLTWLIDNDLLSIDHDDNQLDIIAVKNKTMTGYEFLMQNMDGVLTRDDLSSEIIEFVDEFYDEYLGNKGYSGYMEDRLKRCVLGVEFNWEDYEKIKEDVIDIAYQKFQKEEIFDNYKFIRKLKTQIKLEQIEIIIKDNKEEFKVFCFKI